MNYASLKAGKRPRTPQADDGGEMLNPLNASKLFSYLLTTYADQDCELSLSKAAKRLSKYAERTVSEKEALVFIGKYRERFLLKNVDGKQFVEARTSIKLCDDFQKGKCRKPICPRLHICRFYLQGTCKFDEKCTKGHSFAPAETRNLLSQHKLQSLDDEALLVLFKKALKEKIVRHASQSSGAPTPCSFYNKNSGCKNGDKCQFLHVCDHYVSGECKFGNQKCKRDHHFDAPHSRRILANHRLGHLRNNSQILLVLREASGINPQACSPDSDNDGASFNDFLQSLSSGGGTPSAKSPTAASVSPDTKLEICGFNLRGKCNYGEKCNARHTSLPYQWEYSSPDQKVWSSFANDENKNIEKAFCDCSQYRVNETTNERSLCLIDFQTLTGKLRQHGQGPESGVTVLIRRLSTVSSVLAAEGHVYRTKWQWYWQDENDKWRLYDDSKTDTSSEKIEQDYLSDSVDKKHEFSQGSNKYFIYMNDPTHLYQQNQKYQTKRDVRRRPAKFVDQEAMKRMMEEFKLKRQRTTSTGSSGGPSVPDHWAPLDPAEEFQLVRIRKDTEDDEYSRIEKQFMETMNGHDIKSIHRVQNAVLWEDYERQLSKITKKNSGAKPEERWLFHGTNQDTVQPICQQGFDWRLSGKHGTRYGKGSYFATEASYSNNYARSSSALSSLHSILRTTSSKTSVSSQMFMAKVIVGSYVVGSYETSRPPSKDSSDPLSPLHDSCVNDVSRPTIFVVFERSQAYPYYIIEYQ